MRIGIVNVDSLIANLALMKLTTGHREAGDEVYRYDPLYSPLPDRIYASKIFEYSPEYAYFPDGVEVVRGGSAYDPMVRLPEEWERVYPAYDIFDADYAVGRISRGCPRRCPWCVVPKMDGQELRQVGSLDDFVRDQKRVRLLDDNLTAMSELFTATCEELTERKLETKFDALDVRLMTPEMAAALTRVRRWGLVHFAFDHPNAEKLIRRGIEALAEGGFPLSKAMFYVLIGFNTTPAQDLYRVEMLRSLGCDPFVMPFDKTNEYQRQFARWANHKAIFKTVPWEEYEPRYHAHTKAPETVPLFPDGELPRTIGKPIPLAISPLGAS